MNRRLYKILIKIVVVPTITMLLLGSFSWPDHTQTKETEEVLAASQDEEDDDSTPLDSPIPFPPHTLPKDADGNEIPFCCIVKLFDRRESTIKDWVEKNYPECPPERTYYYDTKAGEQPPRDLECVNQSHNCPFPLFMEIKTDFESHQLEIIAASLLVPGFSAVMPIIEAFKFVRLLKGYDDGNGFSVAVYFPQGTRVYGTLSVAWKDRPINTCDLEDNPTVPKECNPSARDSKAATNCDGNNNYCGYYRCLFSGVWGVPPSEEFKETCPLNPIFSYPTGEYEGAQPVLETEGIPTAIGCFPSTPKGIVTAILRIFTGIAGTIAVGTILFSIIMLMTQGDNPEKVKDSYSRITYAAIGLAVIVLSIFLLSFLGVSILNLPKFGGGELLNLGG